MLKVNVAPRTQNIYWEQGTPIPQPQSIFISLISMQGSDEKIISASDSVIFDNSEIPWLLTDSFSESLYADNLSLKNLDQLQPGTYTASVLIQVNTLDDFGEAYSYVTLTVAGATHDPTNPTDPTEPDNNFGPKYWMESTNIDGDVYRLSIEERGYEGAETEIQGRVVHKYQSKKDLLESITASYLQVQIEASSGLSMQDLYSEKENTFKATLLRNNEIIFTGWLKPDGIYESLVEDYWILDIDAYDGLSTLKNLSFVKPDGTFYTSKMSVLAAITACLNRTGLRLPVNVCVELFYEGFDGKCVLEDTIINTERYYQDAAKKDIMDCEAVLKSLLKIFNANVIQMNGEWFVYRPIDVKNGMKLQHYVDGVWQSEKTYNPATEIGSHINNAAIFYCNENQKKTIDASVQAYRLYYKYGNARSLVDNPYLDQSPKGTLNVPGWRIGSMPGARPDPSGSGVVFRNNSVNETSILFSDQNVPVRKDDSIDFEVDISYTSVEILVRQRVEYFIYTENYYLRDGSGWQPRNGAAPAAPSGIVYFYQLSDGINWKTTTPPCPEDGNIHIDLHGKLFAMMFDFKINYITVTPSQTNIKGQYYTGQRQGRISSVTKENDTVYNGDSLSDIFVGTLYKNSNTPTQLWNREGVSELKELLEINVEDVLRISPRPMQVFEGDVCGYFPYLSLFSLSLISGNFLTLSYEFNTQSNVNRFSAKEISTDILSSSELMNGRVEIEPDLGQETKVTVR